MDRLDRRCSFPDRSVDGDRATGFFILSRRRWREPASIVLVSSHFGPPHHRSGHAQRLKGRWMDRRRCWKNVSPVKILGSTEFSIQRVDVHRLIGQPMPDVADTIQATVISATVVNGRGRGKHWRLHCSQRKPLCRNFALTFIWFSSPRGVCETPKLRPL